MDEKKLKLKDLRDSIVSRIQGQEETGAEAGQEELYTLFEIIKAVNSTLDTDEVLERILTESLSLFEAEAGSIMLKGREGYLTIRAAVGLSPEIISKVKVQPGEGIAGWVFSHSKSLLLDGKVSDARFKKVVDRKEKIKSSMAAPLISKGETMGVLMIRRSKMDRYTEKDRRMIEIIADQVAIAIDNAARFELEQERAEQLRQLNEELGFEKLKIETILKSMADGVVVLDSGGFITMINRASCDIIEKTELELLGKHFDLVFPEKINFEEINTALFVQKYRFRKDIILYEGEDEEFFYRILATGMKSEDERVEGIVVVIQNITQLKRLDKMKTEFVSMVSHELRTPLTSIQGFTELIMMRDFIKERRDRYLNIILKDSKRLSRLIENLLDLSKLEAGQIQFSREPVDIVGLMPVILATFEGQTKKHEIVFVHEGKVPVMMLDKDMFINVITNLVSNAIKYSPEGGEIRVLAQRSQSSVIISVKDYGVGLADDMKTRVFEKFFRVDNSLTRETGGTGLGLATVKYIVEGFGGKIWVESELGKGSEFFVTLPIEDV